MLTREDLDAAVCSTPGCTHTTEHGMLFLHGKCHPGAPTQTAYTYDGVLHIVCAMCQQSVIDVVVATARDLGPWNPDDPFDS